MGWMEGILKININAALEGIEEDPSNMINNYGTITLEQVTICLGKVIHHNTQQGSAGLLVYALLAPVCIPDVRCNEEGDDLVRPVRDRCR